MGCDSIPSRAVIPIIAALLVVVLVGGAVVVPRVASGDQVLASRLLAGIAILIAAAGPWAMWSEGRANLLSAAQVVFGVAAAWRYGRPLKEGAARGLLATGLRPG